MALGAVNYLTKTGKLPKTGSRDIADSKFLPLCLPSKSALPVEVAMKIILKSRKKIALCFAAMFGATVLAVAASTWAQAPSNTEAGSLSQLHKSLSQPSLDTTLISFSVEGVKYTVPRNYLVSMNDWKGGPQSQVRFQITFPGFEPLSDTTQKCLAAPASGDTSKCRALEFWLVRGNKSSDEDTFRSGRVDSAAPKPGPAGFEVYTRSFPDKVVEPTTVKIYRKQTSAGSIIIYCTHTTLQNGKTDEYCENTYGSPMPNGNGIHYRLSPAQIVDAEKIDDGIRSLVDSFRIKGDKP